MIGTKDEVGLARDIKSITKSKPLVATGKTDLMKLATLIKRCKLVVTSDSAPMHIAASMNVPCVALFGPTEPARHVVPGGKITILKKDLKCSPCYKPVCRKGLGCMKKITLEDILSVAEKYLREIKHENITVN